MRGGVNLELLARISALEQRIADVEQHATQENYGIVRLSDSRSVTELDGLALSAREKNSSITGTLANEMYITANKLDGLIASKASVFYAGCTFGSQSVNGNAFAYVSFPNATNLSLEIRTINVFYVTVLNLTSSDYLIESRTARGFLLHIKNADYTASCAGNAAHLEIIMKK